MNNYNLIAPFYGILKRLVFSDNLEQFECGFLKDAPRNSKLLVIGSGEANFLKKLDLKAFSNIVLIDKSAKMLQIAKNSYSNEDIEYVNEDWMTLNISDKFDVIALPFILDCIPEDQIDNFVNRVIEQCADHGQIVITDFESNPKKSLPTYLLLKLMYLFFFVSTRIGRMQVPHYEKLFEQKKLQKIGYVKHASLPIFSMLYKKL